MLFVCEWKKGGAQPARRVFRPAAPLSGLLALTLVLAPSAAGAEEAPKWGPWIDFEGKAGTKRNLGETDAFLPLAQDDDTLFFANAKFRFDDRDSLEGNLGLGLRHMLEDGWNLGAYGYLDHRRSSNDKSYNQITFGAEALGRDFDFRANSYWPIGDRTHGLGSSGGESTATLTGTTIEVATPGATIREERALRGFDAEVGWRVPVFEAEGPLDLRVYAGAFTFDDRAVDDVTGPRLRAEFTAYEVPYLWEGARLTLGAEWQHDDVRGGQAFASLRLRVPLQVFDSVAPSRLTLQERRMAAPVVRDVDIVAQTRSETTPATVETATTTADGSVLTVLDSGSTSGAALPGAVAAAGADSTVILTGTFNTTATVTMQNGQTLMGAGSLTVRTPSGRTAVLTTPKTGTIAGAGFVSTIAMANDSTVAGLTVSNTGSSFARGIFLNGTSNAAILDSAVTATAQDNVQAIGTAGTITTLTVRGNTLTATADDSLGSAAGLFMGLGGTVETGVTVAGNTFNSVAPIFASTISAGGTTFVTAASTGNVVVNGTCNAGGNIGSVSFTDGSTCP